MAPLPALWSQTHPVIERAMAAVRRAGLRTTRSRGAAVSFLEDELRHDAIGVAALALLSRRDPVKAVSDFLRAERAWHNATAPFLLDGLLEEAS